MEFKKYQGEALKTDQLEKENENRILIPYLGLMGEIGSVVSEFKKQLRDGNKYKDFENNLSEELGDVLWYISNIASKSGIDFEKIAKKNIKKVRDRWSKEKLFKGKLYDERFPKKERIPREFTVSFTEKIIKKQTKTIIKVNGKVVGNELTDNAHKKDGYRFHDIFHFGFAAYLGWSPVVRKLLKKKRKSNIRYDEVEDGGRATAIEEGLSAFIFAKSLESHNFNGITTIDYEFLRTIRKLVYGLEVKNRSLLEWETTILESYKIFRELIANNGGRVFVSLKNRKLTYLGK
jgi:NTP pyrophosphatase (non-canonical NTP hydrolase)